MPIKISETNTVLQDYQGLIADHGGMVPQETVLDFISQESERVQMRIEKPGANPWAIQRECYAFFREAIFRSDSPLDSELGCSAMDTGLVREIARLWGSNPPLILRSFAPDSRGITLDAFWQIADRIVFGEVMPRRTDFFCCWADRVQMFSLEDGQDKEQRLQTWNDLLKAGLSLCREHGTLFLQTTAPAQRKYPIDGIQMSEAGVRRMKAEKTRPCFLRMLEQLPSRENMRDDLPFLFADGSVRIQ